MVVELDATPNLAAVLINGSGKAYLVWSACAGAHAKYGENLLAIVAGGGWGDFLNSARRQGSLIRNLSGTWNGVFARRRPPF